MQEGARRETEEETELRVEVGRLIGVYSRPHAGIVTIAFEATVVGGRAEPAAETSEVRAFGPDEIPWDEIAFSTAESALRDWVAGLPGRGSAFQPELYVEGDPDGIGHLAAHRDARRRAGARSRSSPRIGASSAARIGTPRPCARPGGDERPGQQGHDRCGRGRAWRGR